MAFVGRLARPTIAAAAVATGYAYTTSSTLQAEEVPSRYASIAQPGRNASGEKLPIYPSGSLDPVVTLVEVENPITPYIAQARQTTTEAFSGVSETVQAGVGRWIQFERSAEREIKTILPADESLSPGLIYVLISGLTGSVLTRTRSFPVRLLAPPLFALASLPYFLPRTSHSLREYLGAVEDKHFPEVAEKHDIINERLSMHAQMLKNKVDSTSMDVGKWSHKAAEGIESTTGLKVGEAIRRGRERVEEERAKLSGRVQVGSEPVKVQTVGYVIETKPVAEIVAPVTASPRVEAATPVSPPAPVATPRIPVAPKVATPPAAPVPVVAAAVVPPPADAKKASSPVLPGNTPSFADDAKKDGGKRLV